MLATNFRIAEVALRVSNLNRAVKFYQEVIGFRFHHREENVVFLEVGALDSPLGEVGHPQLLALFDRGTSLNQNATSFDHIAFEVPRDEFEHERERFRALNMVISERSWPESLPWDGKSFFVKDPDLNVVEFIAANQ